ncbi:unnamed protein product [Pylaiella littoralis]
MILLMAVLDTKCILFSCVQSGYADQRRQNCRRILLLRPSTERCLATVTAVPATTSSPAPSPPPRSSRAVRYRNSSTRQRVAAFGSFGTNATRLPPPQAQQVCWEPRRKWKHQHQHQGDKAVVVVMPRRTLRFSSSTFDLKQQEQQYGHDRNSTERKPEHHTDGEANVDHVRRAQLGSAARGGSGSSDRSEEEMTKPAIDKESDRVWTVPNMITMGRIVFCPFLAGLIVTSQHELALAGLLAASLTDWLDGYIARKWNQKARNSSVLGGFLDPLADKVMVTTVALALGQEGIIPAALVAVMVGRDALLIAGSLAYRYKTRQAGDAFFDLDSIDYKVTPSTLSKVNTVLQFGTLWLGLTNSVYLVPGDAVFSGLCVATGVATLASGANYLLVSGLKPRGKLGKRFMIQRETLQERYRQREVLVREKMGVGRERLRLRKDALNDKLKARRNKVAGALKNRINKGGRARGARGFGVKKGG